MERIYEILSVMKEKFAERIKVVKYEDLLTDTEKAVQELFDFSHISFGAQTKKFIYESQNKTVDDPYSVYRKKDCKREKKVLPENIIEEIHHDLEKFEEANKYGYI